MGEVFFTSITFFAQQFLRQVFLVFCSFKKLPKFALALPYNSWCNEPNIRKIGSDISRLSNEPIVHADVDVSVDSDENLFDI